MGGKVDLMDALDAVLPRVDPAEEAREIVGVMARIAHAATGALLVERHDTLQWLAGDPLPRGTARSIRAAWRAQRRRLLSGMAFTEAPAPASRPVRTWLMWIRRPDEAGLDAVYLAGVNLRPLTACSAPLSRLATLLARINVGP